MDEPARGAPRRAGLTFLAVTLAVGGWLAVRDVREVAALGAALQSIAAEAAASIDGAAHERVRGAEDAEFAAIRHRLRDLRDRRHVRSDLYTLRPVGGGDGEFVVMTNETPFVGERYRLRPEMAPVLATGAETSSGLYRSGSGWWISGFAPVLHEGRPVALVSVDRPSADRVTLRIQRAFASVLAGAVAAALAAVGPALVTRAGPITGLRRWLGSSLALRIGLAGSAAVLAAVGVAGWLDHRQARAELLAHLGDRLLTVVRVAAPQISAADHAVVSATGDAESPAFVAMRDTLRHVQEAAGLSSPMYTLRRDGELARYVAMTNETPFVGDSYELRSGVERTFETGEPGTEGPYVDAHGTWISAWAPIRAPGGDVVGVLQADYEVGAFLAELRTVAMRKSMFGLAGVAVAFAAAGWLARNIARPIRAIAMAAQRVGRGDLTVSVPEDRLDEVGDLARAMNQMVGGLRERDRLGKMFGAYVSPDVARRLLAQGGLSVAGERREISVLISDIRGYTSLTESLGAEEVVSLLNEYFGILVAEAKADGGHVDKFMGDAMLCLFGAIEPMPDHRQRAVRAAVRMLERLAQWNAGRVAAGLRPVETGIGVASGMVIVGSIGAPATEEGGGAKYEYTAIGDAVNLASRLCSKAEEREIVASDEIRRASDDPRFVDEGSIPVKGIREPVPVHRLRIG